MADHYSPRLRSVRVLLADDHEIVRNGIDLFLRGYQDLEIVGAFPNGRQLLDAIPDIQPDIIVTDIRMPVMDGIEAAHCITSQYPQIPVLALTGFCEEHIITKMLDAGASGYLLKNASREELVEAIRSVLSGQNYFCKNTNLILSRMIGRSRICMRDIRPLPTFSEKELQIIIHICEEKANKEIAYMMHLNQRSVESARERIFKKMGVKNTAGMAIYAIRHRLYQP